MRTQALLQQVYYLFFTLTFLYFKNSNALESFKQGVLLFFSWKTPVHFGSQLVAPSKPVSTLHGALELWVPLDPFAFEAAFAAGIVFPIHLVVSHIVIRAGDLIVACLLCHGIKLLSTPSPSKVCGRFGR